MPRLPFPDAFPSLILAHPASSPSAWSTRRETAQGTPRPLVIAHRGASRLALENTMPAFRRAFDEGADGIELDVRRCRSGEVVVFHDRDLKRLAGIATPIDALDWSTLKQLPLNGGGRIPLLEEVLTDPHVPYLINIELKGDSWAATGLEVEVVSLIKRHCAGQRVAISSFNPLILNRMMRLAPELPRGFLYQGHDTRSYLRRPWLVPFFRPHNLHPHHPLVEPRLIRWAPRLGYGLMTWTVDDPAEQDRLIAAGVLAIITNDPGPLIARLQA